MSKKKIKNPIFTSVKYFYYSSHNSYSICIRSGGFLSNTVSKKLRHTVGKEQIKNGVAII